MRRRFSTSLRNLIALVALLMSTVVQADFKRDYGRALKDLQNGDTTRAIELLSSAIADNPESAERVRIYGMRFEPYLPHYYLGKAHAQAGDCTAASAAYAEAARQGVIDGTDLAADFTRSRAECAGSAEDLNSLAGDARDARSRLQQALERMRRFAADQSAQSFTGSDSTWKQTIDAAQRAEAEFDQLLSYAQQQSDAEAIRNLTAQTQTLTDSLGQVLANTQSQLAALAQQARSDEVEKTAAERRQLIQTIASVRSAPSSPTGNAAIEQQRSALNALVSRAENLSSSATLAQIQQLNRDISSGLRRYRSSLQEFQAEQQARASKAPPEPLLLLARGYFAGEYEQVVRQARPDQFDDTRHRIQALLFRAAAQYTLHALSPAGDDALLRAARADILQIKQLDARFTPYLTAFSPRFVALFEQTSR